MTAGAAAERKVIERGGVCVEYFALGAVRSSCCCLRSDAAPKISIHRSAARTPAAS